MEITFWVLRNRQGDWRVVGDSDHAKAEDSHIISDWCMNEKEGDNDFTHAFRFYADVPLPESAASLNELIVEDWSDSDVETRRHA